MDENVTISKEQKRTSLFLGSAISTLVLVNASFVFTRQDKFSKFMPLSIALCAVSVVLTVIGLFSVIRNYKKLSEKKRHVITCVFITLFCGLECYMGVSAVIDLNAKRNAENSAALFVKDKYGIDAKADYIKSHKFSDGDKLTIVKMTADGKDFSVELLTNENAPAKFADNYQLDEIEQAVFDEVSRVYPGGILRDVGIYSSDFLGNGVVEKYFDGTNLDEVIVNCYGGITVDYADTEFDLSDPILESLKKWKIQPYFTSFDTKERLEEFVGAGNSEYVSQWKTHYARYAPYINDRVIHKDKEIVREKYDIKSYGDFDYFYLFGSDDKSLTKSPIITEAENGSRDIEKKFAAYDESQLIDKPVSDVYELHGRSGSHFIYCPLEYLSASDNIGAAWISYQSGIPGHGVEKASLCGDYAVFTLPYNAYEFMMVDTSGYNEDNQR